MKVLLVLQLIYHMTSLCNKLNYTEKKQLIKVICMMMKNFYRNILHCNMQASCDYNMNFNCIGTYHF